MDAKPRPQQGRDARKRVRDGHGISGRPEGRYYVLCDECKTLIRRTDSLHESACGGHCDSCNTKLDAEYPSRAENRRKLGLV